MVVFILGILLLGYVEIIRPLHLSRPTAEIGRAQSESS